MYIYIYMWQGPLGSISFLCLQARKVLFFSFFFSFAQRRSRGEEEKRRRGEEEKKEERRKGKAKGEGEGREKGERRKEKGNLILLLETTSVVCAIYRFPLHSICQVFPG